MAVGTILSVLLITAVAVGAQTTGSPFNTYAVFLDRAQVPGGCSVTDTEHFRNRAYAFRGWMRRDTPLVLRDGKALERNDVGTGEWETELVRQSVVTLGGQSAVMLQFFANHVGGSGSFGTVLIAICSDQQLTVVFEAESEGLKEAAFTVNQDLVVSRAVWSATDAHCCPGGQAEERYSWDRNTNRFARVAAR